MRPIAWLGFVVVVTLGARLLTAAQGGGSIILPAFPTDWGITRFAGNPIIDVSDNPNETDEQYVPAPIRLPSGDVWVYVKGADRIYAWKSTDAETFTLQNGNDAVLAPGSSGAWDDEFVIDPAATYDPVTGTIHLYYKGYNGSTWSIGHATADDSAPTIFTKDAGNPILTSSTVSTDLGGGTVTDLSINDVVKIGSTFHYYGFAEEDGTYQLIQATGSDWDDPSSVESILSAPGGTSSVVISPSVVRTASGKYAMFYTIGGVQLPTPEDRYIRVAESDDAETWDFSDSTNLLSPQGTGWEEHQTYAGSFLKQGSGPNAYVDSEGRWLYYYSGFGDGEYNAGLAYLDPS